MTEVDRMTHEILGQSKAEFKVTFLLTTLPLNKVFVDLNCVHFQT